MKNFKVRVGPAAVPVSVVRAVRDAGSARQSGATPHLHFGFGLSEIIHQHSCLISQSRQSKQSWHSSVSHGSQSSRGTWSSRCMQRRRHTLRTTPTTDTPRTMGGYRARSGIAPQTTRRTDGGEAESHTHRSSTDTLHVSARSMWPALSPLLSPFQRRRAATRRAEPVSAGDLGAARDAGMRDGSVGSVPKADRLGCELRQPPFLYPLDHVQAVGGRAGWPRAGGGEGVRR